MALRALFHLASPSPPGLHPPVSLGRSRPPLVASPSRRLWGFPPLRRLDIWHHDYIPDVLQPSPYCVTLTTDASSLGWGPTCFGERWAEGWLDVESSNWRELAAVTRALRVWSSRLGSHRLLVRWTRAHSDLLPCDNITKARVGFARGPANGECHRAYQVTGTSPATSRRPPSPNQGSSSSGAAFAKISTIRQSPPPRCGPRVA